MSADLTTSVREGLRLLRRTTDGVFEIRALKSKHGTVSGYFSNCEDAAVAVEQANGTLDSAEGVYVTLNPVRVDVHARAHNRLKTFAKTTTADDEVLHRAWFPLDCDPHRPKGVSATDAEREAALQRRDAVVAALRARGWPAPAVCSSGNGGHALCACDLPNTPKITELFRDAIAALAAQFDDDVVTIDRSVFNASRIWKLPGTWARKGDSTPERPHRRAEIEEVPDRLDLVSLEQLEALAAEAPSSTTSTPPRSNVAAAVLAKVEVFRTFTKDSTTYYEIRCPWFAEHTTDPDSGTIFTVNADGAVGFKCQHAHCVDRHWPELRDYLGIDRKPTASEQAVIGEFQQFFITQLGSKDGGRRITMVGCDETFPPHFQTYEAFRQYFCDTRIKIGTKWTTRAELWLQNRLHRKYTDVQFLPPPLDVPPGVLNLWNGFAVQADPDPHPEERCALFLAHVRQVICAGEAADVAEFLLDVLAKKVQEPARLTEVSIAIRGGQGVGKNTLTDYYGGLFGRHAATVDKQELVTGRFNAVLSSKLVLTLDEAMWPGHKEFIGALKSLVTNAFLMVERKGIDPVRERNFVQTFVLTNGVWAWPTELGDRRALIVDVSDAQKGKTPYFDALYHERDRGGLAALLACLQQRTLTHDLRLVPHTKARVTQVALTDDDPVRSMWFDMLHRGLTWPESEIWDDFISSKDLEEYYAEWCRATRQKALPVKLLLQRWHEMLPPTFGHPKQRRLIDRELIIGARKRGGWPRDKDGIAHLPDQIMRRGTVVPGLDACRTYYAEHVEHHVINWPEPPDPEPPCDM